MDRGGNASSSASGKFEMNRWPSILFAFLNVLAASKNDKYLPEKTKYGNALEIVYHGGMMAMELYMELNRNSFPVNVLEYLDKDLVPLSIEAVYQIFCLNRAISETSADFNGIKLHLLLHMPWLIRRFGSPRNWDTGTFESAHKDFVKHFYKHGNKQTTDIAKTTLRSVRDLHHWHLYYVRL